MNLIDFAHRHQRAIIFTISVLTFAGIYAAFNLTRDIVSFKHLSDLTRFFQNDTKENRSIRVHE